MVRIFSGAASATADAVIPPKLCATSTTGPCWRSSTCRTASRYNFSVAFDAGSGFPVLPGRSIAIDLYPLALNSILTCFHTAAVSKAPWRRTIVGCWLARAFAEQSASIVIATIAYFRVFMQIRVGALGLNESVEMLRKTDHA